MPMTTHSITSRLASPGVLARGRAAAFLAAGALLVALPATRAVAQVAGTPTSQQAATTPPKSAARLELERQAASLEAAGKATEAAAVRRRLTEGDLQVGDRIVLQVTGGLTVQDTLPVREGQVISVPTLPDISVRGVLRPELNDYLTAQLQRYVRDLVVHSTPLMRVSVTGAVGRPGFYAMPADILLGDAIMWAGGLTGNAETQKTVVKRGTGEALSRDAVQKAIRSGATLEQLGLRAGDEIVVGEKKERNWLGIIGTVAGLTTAVLSLVFLLHNN